MGRFKDLTGQRFGRLTVIKRIENFISSSGKVAAQWLCKCDCGSDKEVVVITNSLTSGNTQSCGCLQKERLRKARKKYNKYNLSGEFGIGYTSNTNEPFYFDLEDYDKIKNYCWLKNKNNYIMSTSKHNGYKAIFMHRLVIDCPDDMKVDHINHKKNNNRKSNLRFATVSQNAMNQKLSSNNTSGVKGVSWNKEQGKWSSQIMLNRKNKFLGYFDNFEDAVKARKEAEDIYHGEYKWKGKSNGKKNK